MFIRERYIKKNKNLIMKWIKLYEEFQLGDLNSMSPEEIQDLFFEECKKQTPDINLIKNILDNGLLDVNAKNKNGQTPLDWVVRQENVDITKLLIKAGADVNAKSDFDSVPLFWPVMQNNIEIANLLIKAGADLNARDKDNAPLLTKAYSKEMKHLLMNPESHPGLNSIKSKFKSFIDNII